MQLDNKYKSILNVNGLLRIADQSRDVPLHVVWGNLSSAHRSEQETRPAGATGMVFVAPYTSYTYVLSPAAHQKARSDNNAVSQLVQRLDWS